MRIAVVSMHGTPLSPTTPAKARKLIQSGGAIPNRDTLGTFYLQLTTPTGETIAHETSVGIDPGTRDSGVGVQPPPRHPMDRALGVSVLRCQASHETPMALASVSSLSQNAPTPDALSASDRA